MLIIVHNRFQEHRVLLTGTPLQNNVEELYSLLNFLEPKQFASQEAFMNDFGNLKSEGQVDKLKAVSIHAGEKNKRGRTGHLPSHIYCILKALRQSLM